MPNGADKNWVRLCAAIDGFKVRHGVWPKRVRVDPHMLDDVRSLFSRRLWKRVSTKIELIAESDVPFVAEDETGTLRYSYGEEGFCQERPVPDARHWLGVEPDQVEE